MMDYQEHTATDAEMSVVGAILIDPRCLPAILETELIPEDFSDGPIRKIFSISCQLYTEGREIDPVIIRAEAPEDLPQELILQLMETTPTAVNAAHYARIVKRTTLQRKTAATAMSLSQPGADVAAALEELQDLAYQQMQINSSKKRGIDFFREFVENIQTDTYTPYQTGMPEFDRLLSGGLRAQELVMLGGAPGIGKTAFTQQLFEGIAAQGTPVLYFNLEMSREQLFARSISRLIAREGGSITPAEVMDGTAWTEDQGRQIENACRLYARDVAPYISYNPMSGRTAALGAILGAMTAAAESAKRSGGTAPAVVLDYLQLVEGEAKQEQAEVIKRAVKAMKDYAIRYNTFVFVIMANNRESNKSGKASMDSGRDTSAIEYSADTMLQLVYTASMKRDGEKTLTPDQILSIEDERTRIRVRSDVTLRVVKKRNGEPGRSMRFYFDGASSRYALYDSRHDNFDVIECKTPFDNEEGRT